MLKRIVFIGLMCLVSACTLIDDDLSNCGEDYYLHYEMQLVTEMDMTITSKLSAEADKPTAAALRSWLSPILNAHAHDLDMNFYSLDETDILRHHYYEIIDAQQKTFTLYIPREDYMHLAVVNTADNNIMSISGKPHAATMRVEQLAGDTLPSHPTAIFTARKPMLMAATEDLSFHVHLYTVNSAVALIIEEEVDSAAMPVSARAPEQHADEIEMLISGTATGFDIRDSVFSYEHPSLIRAEKVNANCYAAIVMPAQPQWSAKVYVLAQDGTITENILTIDTPLQAGNIEIIKVKKHADGSLEAVENAEVGITITLDWKNGGEHEIEM